MGLDANKNSVEKLEKRRLEEFILETFILVLIESGNENHGKNLISSKILTRSFIVQVIMKSVSINMVLNAKHRHDFGKQGLDY